MKKVPQPKKLPKNLVLSPNLFPIVGIGASADKAGWIQENFLLKGDLKQFLIKVKSTTARQKTL
jgi:hypothetical protein